MAPPAFTFRGFDAVDYFANNPGPGKYNWERADNMTHVTSAPVSLKFRHKAPGELYRRPGPSDYNPPAQLDVYRGDHTKVTMKRRCDAVKGLVLLVQTRQGCTARRAALHAYLYLPENFEF